jgi:hypothetical protein
MLPDPEEEEEVTYFQHPYQVPPYAKKTFVKHCTEHNFFRKIYK